MPGTIVDSANFDVTKDSQGLYDAMMRISWKRWEVVRILTHRTNAQRLAIQKKFLEMFEQRFVDIFLDVLRRDHFEDIALGLLLNPIEFDAWCVYDALKGEPNRAVTVPEITETALLEVLGSRSNQQIKGMAECYPRVTTYNGFGITGTMVNCPMIQDIRQYTVHFKKLVYSLCQGNRSDEVNQACAEDDAQILFNAGEKSLGTDESWLNVILAWRSFEQLRLIFDAYERISTKTIEEALSSALSADLYDGMSAIVRMARDLPTYFAEQLYTSMTSPGIDHQTTDTRLIRVILSRSEIDLEDIKKVFEEKYGKSVEQFIIESVPGQYRRVLIQILRGNDRFRRPLVKL